MCLKGRIFCVLMLFLITCDDGTTEPNTTEPNTTEPNIEDDDKISSQVIISVVDSAVVPIQRVYIDTFEISSPEHFIDISANIVYLQLDTPFTNISRYTISIDPPVYLPKQLVYTLFPFEHFWHYQAISSGWSISISPPKPEISAIALFGYTTDNTAAVDTLSISLTLNSTPIFSDSTIIVKYNPLTKAVFKSIPATDHPSASSRSIRISDKDLSFSANRGIAGRDPRNIHHFLLYHNSQNDVTASMSSSGMNWSNPTRRIDAYFFFSNLPEL